MKRIKKLATIIMALCLVLALAAPAMAADTYTITIENEADGHTYQAYQIFKGDLKDKTLSNIRWGSGVSNPEGNAAEKAETLTSTDLAKAFAVEISSKLSGTYATSTEGNNVYTISGLEAGYYLVKDADSSLQGDNDAYTEYLVKVVGDVTASPKSSAASMTKKLKDTNDTAGTTTDWQDSADYDIGDTIPYQLLGTLAENVSSFDKYSVRFVDTMSEGLTFNENSVEVKIDGVGYSGTVNVDVKTETSGNTVVTYELPNVAGVATNGSKVEILYNATLNENAVIGSAGNPNVAYMEYSNNPYSDSTGDTMDDELGRTPTDKCIVFTYKTVINKVNKDDQPLDGAEFKLEKILPNDGRKEIKDEVVGGTTFSFVGLDDGTYILTETATPAGYNSIEPITFTVSADHDVLSDNPALNTLSGNKVTGEIEFTANGGEGSLTANVVNLAGAVLPETGGMGTTLFYIAGAAMMLCAGVILVARKRMN